MTDMPSGGFEGDVKGERWMERLSYGLYGLIHTHFHNRKSNVNETDFAFGSGCVLSVPS